MRGEVHIVVYCPIDTLQWGSTHSALYACIYCRMIRALEKYSTTLGALCSHSDHTPS